MKEIDINNWNRYTTYSWFNSFRNSTYGVNVKMDVTKLVKYTKEQKKSFFINLLFIVMKGLNSIDEMRMRIENNIPVIYDDINPSFTVLTKSGIFQNVRFENTTNYQEFYDRAHKYIEEAKEVVEVKKDSYNPTDRFNEYYITCTPWLDFTGLTHPIPDDKSSQVVPRVCWGKFVDNNGKLELTLNITVSHIFVDGYPLSQVFKNIQDYLDDCENILK